MNFTTTALAAGALMTIFVGVPITAIVSQTMEILAIIAAISATTFGAYKMTPTQ